MSIRHTAVPMQITPDNMIGVEIYPGSGWNEATPFTTIISPTLNEIHVAGLMWSSNNSGTAEIEFAISGVDLPETLIHTYRVHVRGTVNNSDQYVLFPVPLGNIPAGVTLSMRMLSDTGALPINFWLMYYENLATDHKNPAPCRCFPTRANNFEVDMPVNPWTWTDWQLIDLGQDNEITLIDFFVNTPPGNEGGAAELQLSIGPEGNEEIGIITTSRFYKADSNFKTQIILPGGFPLAPYTRLSFRVRGNAVSVGEPSRYSFNYVYGTSFVS